MSAPAKNTTTPTKNGRKQSHCKVCGQPSATHSRAFCFPRPLDLPSTPHATPSTGRQLRPRTNSPNYNEDQIFRALSPSPSCVSSIYTNRTTPLTDLDDEHVPDPQPPPQQASRPQQPQQPQQLSQPSQQVTPLTPPPSSTSSSTSTFRDRILRADPKISIYDSQDISFADAARLEQSGEGRYCAIIRTPGNKDESRGEARSSDKEWTMVGEDSKLFNRVVELFAAAARTESRAKTITFVDAVKTAIRLWFLLMACAAALWTLSFGWTGIITAVSCGIPLVAWLVGNFMVRVPPYAVCFGNRLLGCLKLDPWKGLEDWNGWNVWEGWTWRDYL